MSETQATGRLRVGLILLQRILRFSLPVWIAASMPNTNRVSLRR